MKMVENIQSEYKVKYIAEAKSSRELFSLAERVARFSVPVMITGETGTGKECVAKYIHQHGNNPASPYVGVNCAAIPENMLEAILFGYEKGAFTGAISSQPGKFELANGGTLLLDEIGDMPLTLQVKILRVLQEQEVERLGSHKKIPLNLRIIASTNRDLAQEIIEGRFRQDLFYRLAVVPLHIAPLRERPQDILPLTRFFISKYQSIVKRNVEMTSCAREALENYSWPGNVRELENVIQRGLIMCNGDKLCASCFGLPVSASVAKRTQFTVASGHWHEKSLMNNDESQIKKQGRIAEFQYILDLLNRYKGNKSKTAEFLGITPRALRYRLASMRQQGFDTSCFS